MTDALKRKLPAYTNSGICEKIDDLIHDETDRQILKYKLVDNKTVEAISELMNIPFSTVRDHYAAGLDILFPRK